MPRYNKNAEVEPNDYATSSPADCVMDKNVQERVHGTVPRATFAPSSIALPNRPGFYKVWESRNVLNTK